MDHAKSLILLLGLCILSACVFQPGNVKVEIQKKKSFGQSNTTPKSISSVSVINNQIKVTGVGLEGVTSLKIQNNNLNETFSIESASSTQIIANASHALSIGVGQVFDLILSNAYGDATFPVSFSLDNGSVTAVMLSSMGASAGQILKYNGAAWVPSSISSSQLYIGTWNANTNTPDLNLTTPQAGDYYVVTTAGTQGAVTYAIGDWIISNGITWSKLSHSSSVVGSFNGRSGLVLPAVGDYTWAQINKTSSKLEDIADLDITGRADQKVLKWDATNSKWIMGNDITGSGAPGPSSITTTEILDGTIANDDLAGSIAQTKITGLTSDLASKLGLTSLSATAPLVYNNTTGGFTINNATALLDGAMSAADKTKLNGLESLSAGNGLVERFSGTLRSNTCADGEILKWVTLTGWTCGPDLSTDASKQTTLTNSAGLASALSDETGTGLAVFNTAPIVTNPDVRGELRLSGSTSGYVGFVPAAVAGATTYKLPITQGTAGQVLSTDGVATNATLSWISPTSNSASITDGSILNADINSAANIDITKLGTGAVSTTEFNYLTGVTSSIQTQLAGKEASITSGASTEYIRGNKTLSVFATDVINSVLSTYSISASAKPAITNTDTVVGAFNKVQKYISDIDGDYVSKSASTGNTVSGVVTFNTIGSLNIGYTPTNATDAVSKAYVDVLGVWAKGAGVYAGDLYRLTGNVGIGTSTPGRQFTVSGASYPLISVQSSGANGGVLELTSNGDNVTGKNIALFNQAGDFRLRPYNTVDPSGITVLQTSGNVGIGTINPTTPLEVTGTVKATAFQGSGAGLTGVLATPAGANGQVQFNGSGSMAASTNLFWDNTNNRLGIGTNSPSVPLHISAGPLFIGPAPSGYSTTGIVVNTASARSSISFLHGSSGQTQTSDGLDLSLVFGNADFNLQENGYMRFLTNNTEKLRIAADGKVGIGTTSATAQLNVASSSTISATNFAASTFSAYIEPTISSVLTGSSIALRATGSATNFYSVGAISQKPSSIDWRGLTTITYMSDTIATDQGFSINQFHPNNSLTYERFRIDSNGNVGIGTSNPTTPLQVNTASTTGFRMGAGTNGDPSLISFGPSNSVFTRYSGMGPLAFFAGGTDAPAVNPHLYIGNTGNVGIGTTSPTVALDVNGSISSQGPAGEATAPSFSVATGGGATVTGYTIDAAVTVGSGFNAATGLFQPTVAGRYLLTANTYSGTSSGWSIALCKNAACNRGAGAIAVPGNGNIANLSRVVYLNGTTDTASAKIMNYTGGTVSGNDTSLTWTKLP